MKQPSWAISFLLFLTLLLTAPGFAQSSPSITKSDVPFAFIAGQQKLPAGSYEISNLAEKTIRIASPIRPAAAVQTEVVQTAGVNGKAPEGAGKLVFHCYSNTCFLVQVWDPGKDIGKQLYLSRAEQELRHREKGREIAVLSY
jgi:hypothetical protein